MSGKQRSKSAKRKKAVAARKRRQPKTSARGRGSRDPASGQPASLATGVQYLNAAQFALAQDEFERVARARPQDAVAWNCLGITHRLRGNRRQALEALGTALRLRPEFAEAHNNLGNTFRDLDRHAEARASYLRAIELKPSFAEAHNNLGVVLMRDGDFGPAVARFRRALECSPRYAEAYNNLGNAYRESGDLDAARESFTGALHLMPEAAEVHNNLANVFRDLGNLTAAREHYQQAIARQPSLVAAVENLGTVLVDLEEYDEAIRVYRRVARFRSDSADARAKVGDVYKKQGKLTEARREYQAAAAMEPTNPLHSLRISALCPTVFTGADELETYRQTTLAAWEQAACSPPREESPVSVARMVEPSFALQFLDGNLRNLKETFARIYREQFPRFALGPRSGKPRIGIVVTRDHEGIFLKSMRGVLERLPDSLADLTIVCPTASATMIREGIQRRIGLVCLPDSLPQARRRILEAAFDVLYYWEIGTDATNYFLPFTRLAPVQCTSWGVQVTSGIPNVDYYLSSDLVETADAEGHYSERLIRADTLLSYQFRDPGPVEPLPRTAFGLAARQNVYLCAQQIGKFHPDFDATIGAILRRDPRGVLVIVEDRLGVASHALRQRLARTVPDVIDRVHFVPRQDRSGYVSLIKCADVLLDPPHFGGVNTTYDALAFGKPVVTCPSPYHRGRYTRACYLKIGVDDCLAADRGEYVDLAVRLAIDPERRRELEVCLAEASENLFEDHAAVVEHERIFRELIDVARRGGTDQ